MCEIKNERDIKEENNPNYNDFLKLSIGIKDNN